MIPSESALTACGIACPEGCAGPAPGSSPPRPRLTIALQRLGLTRHMAAAPLRPGDRVRLVSPASWSTPEWIRESAAVLESWGLVVDPGKHLAARWGYMAGRDEERIADLNDAFRDPAVRAIVATQGGAGAYRICEELDFDAVRNDPKPLLGFSDITYLQLSLWNNAHSPSIHGCLAGETAIATAKQLLMTADPVTVLRKPGAYSAQLQFEGRASGTLLGGSMQAVAHMVGAGLPNLAGAILLLENPRAMGLGRIDRQLTQLRRAGAFNGIRGVALGLFTGYDDHIDRGWTLLDVLNDHLSQLDVPVLGGLNIGHNGVGAQGGPDQVSVTIGGYAEIDTETGTLVVQPLSS